MATEFLSDATERLVTALRNVGISAEVAGMVAAEWQASMERDWGGDRPYIGKASQAARQTSVRDARLLRDWHAGERMAALARKYGISDRHVRRIIAKTGPALP